MRAEAKISARAFNLTSRWPSSSGGSLQNCRGRCDSDTGFHFSEATNKTNPMAEKSLRLSQNASGRFYIDSSCIDCDMCRGTAPEIFRRDDDIGQTIVY